MSYFIEAQNALRAAIDIQTKIAEYNDVDKSKTPILIRIGVHSGNGIVEKNDIYGDVVNVASRFETISDAGEIYFSEETYEALSDKNESGSQLGLTVNGRRVTRQALNDADEIAIGKIMIFFLNPQPEERATQVNMEAARVMYTASAETTMAMEAQAICKLVVFAGTESFSEHPIPPKGLLLGRLPASDVWLNDQMVSRRHAKVWTEDDKIFIEDLESNNGTFVEGKEIPKNEIIEIKEGDEITICSYIIPVFNILKKIDTASSHTKHRMFGLFGKKKNNPTLWIFSIT